MSDGMSWSVHDSNSSGSYPSRSRPTCFSETCGLISVGDLLVEIDGVPVERMGLHSIAKKLHQLVADAEKVLVSAIV
jgi:hypothetical protein